MIVLCEELISSTIRSSILSGDGQANGIGMAVSFIRGRSVFALFFYAVPHVNPGEAGARGRPLRRARCYLAAEKSEKDETAQDHSNGHLIACQPITQPYNAFIEMKRERGEKR